MPSKREQPCEAELWLPIVIAWVRNPIIRDPDGTERRVDLTKGVSSRFVLEHAIGLEDAEMTYARRCAVGRCLRSLGFQWTLWRTSSTKEGKRECLYFPNYDMLGDYPEE